MPLNVRAAVVHGPNQPFVIEDVQLDGPGAGEVLIHVKTTGLCHSDLHVYEGKLPWQFPAILGHEAAGVVVECGPGVTRFKPGDHVIPFLIPHCGKCLYLRLAENKSCASKRSRDCARARVVSRSTANLSRSCGDSARSPTTQ